MSCTLVTFTNWTTTNSIITNHNNNKNTTTNSNNNNNSKIKIKINNNSTIIKINNNSNNIRINSNNDNNDNDNKGSMGVNTLQKTFQFCISWSQREVLPRRDANTFTRVCFSICCLLLRIISWIIPVAIHRKFVLMTLYSYKISSHWSWTNYFLFSENFWHSLAFYKKELLKMSKNYLSNYNFLGLVGLTKF